MVSNRYLKSLTGYPIIQEFNKIGSKLNEYSNSMTILSSELEKSLLFQRVSTDIFNCLINPYLDLNITSRHILSKLIHSLDADAGTLHILENGKFLSLKSSSSVSKDFTDHLKCVSVGETFIGLAAESLTEPKIFNYTKDRLINSSEEKAILKSLQEFERPFENVNNIVITPIKFKEDLVGILSLFTKKGCSFTENKLHLLKSLSSFLALGLKNNILFEKTRRQATRDSLTDLHNRMYFQEFLTLELNRSQRYGKPLSVAIIDIDFFKKINDSYGHNVGDVVLREFADILKKSFRKTDLIARYGGEEFVAVFPEADTDNALRVASKLKKRLNDHYFIGNGKKQQITISMGISAFSPDCQISKSELLGRADKALYHSKENGRNKISVWDGNPDSAFYSAN